MAATADALTPREYRRVHRLLLRSRRTAGREHEPIPKHYLQLPAEELDQRIDAVRRKLGERVLILGHHYQRDEVIKYADLRGDSFKLATFAANQRDSEYIIFCGVHFMAESADILTAPHQSVILPNLTAGCSMADMADIDDIVECWEQLTDAVGESIVPVTYMNSTAVLKAFCGAHGGIVCTSSNAAAVYEWAMERGEKILFFPDQHLGRNTGLKFGIPLDEMVVWDPVQPVLGGNTEADVRNAQVVLWKGWCSVHTRFTVKQIEFARRQHPDVNVIVHPECPMEVVQAADYNGSTEFILKTITEAPAGTAWSVGTEINMVNRMADENPDKKIFCLDPIVCPCSTMYRIHPAYIAWVMEDLLEGKVTNQVSVDSDVAHWAVVSLNRMLTVH